MQYERSAVLCCVQNFHSGELTFRAYDHGTNCSSVGDLVHETCNQLKYGSIKPPVYDLRKVTAPVVSAAGRDSNVPDWFDRTMRWNQRSGVSNSHQRVCASLVNLRSCSEPSHGRVRNEWCGEHVWFGCCCPLRPQVVLQGEIDIMSTANDIDEQVRQIGRHTSTIVYQQYAHMDFVGTAGVCCCLLVLYGVSCSCSQGAVLTQVGAYAGDKGLLQPSGACRCFLYKVQPQQPLIAHLGFGTRIHCAICKLCTLARWLAGWTAERCTCHTACVCCRCGTALLGTCWM
jgi:hypothetical protein